MKTHAPQGWRSARLRFKARVNPRATLDLQPTDQVSFVPMEAVGDDGSLELDRTRAVAEVSQGYTYFENGDVSIAKITPCFENGKGAVMDGLVGGAGFGTTELIVLRPEEGISPKFLYYVTQSDHFRNPGEAAMLGSGGQKRVPDLFVKDFLTRWPAPEVQLAIAAYLDAETARIDGLIDEKRRLCRLLNELLTTSVSTAVSRGLRGAHPASEPADVYWGSVCAKWTIAPLKRVVGIRITDGPHETPVLVEEGVPFVSAEAVKDGRIDFDRIRGFISDADHKTFCQKIRPQRGDVFVVKSGATTGNVGYVDTDAEFSIWSPLAVIRSLEGISDSRYLFWAIASPQFQLAVQMNWSAGTQPNIGMGVLENLRIPLPGMEEQREIAAYLDDTSARVQALIQHTESEITLLNDLRASTITDAVLGHIDVREYMNH